MAEEPPSDPSHFAPAPWSDAGNGDPFTRWLQRVSLTRRDPRQDEFAPVGIPGLQAVPALQDANPGSPPELETRQPAEADADDVEQRVADLEICDSPSDDDWVVV